MYTSVAYAVYSHWSVSQRLPTIDMPTGAKKNYPEELDTQMMFITTSPQQTGISMLQWVQRSGAAAKTFSFFYLDEIIII